MKKIIFIIFSIIYLPAFSQINDNFSDNDFLNNPTWSGDQAKFIVNNVQQLQLNSAGSDTSYLSTPNSLMADIEWNFYVKLSFSPSDNNNARVYLVSNSANLKAALNGYYIMLGENGSDDSVDLYRQTGTTVTKIIDGINGRVASGANTLRIKVTRSATGVWNVYSDILGGSNFQLEGTTTDNVHTTTSFFGVFCKYTTSNATKFYFDDVYVGGIVADTIPPQFVSVTVIPTNKLDLKFSESLDPTSSQNTANYFIDNGIGNPSSAVRDAINTSIVHLTFATPFDPDFIYTITVSGISDLVGNMMSTNSKVFGLYAVRKYDVVINEIMADPSPTVALPDFEYVELYNKSNFPINILNWKLSYGSTTKSLPDATIEPDSFIVLTSSSALMLFSGINVAEIPGVSSTAFTNGGTTITLRDSLLNFVHSISYTDSWYQNSAKKEGGWSLEQIDPNNPCGEGNNWRASVAPAGGTPGRRNSINASTPDITQPYLNRVSLQDSVTLVLYFNEPMDSLSLIDPMIYTIDNGFGNPLFASPSSPDFKKVTIVLPQPVLPGIIYTVTVTNTVKDCVGNIISSDNTARFAIPAPIQPLDLVINEILFNPFTNGVDFVEIYNRTNKIYDLKNLRLSSYDTILQLPTSLKEIAPEGYLIFPGDYIVLTTNPEIVKAQYNTPNPKNFVRMPSLPAFNVGDGTCEISNQNGTRIDFFAYVEKMHIPLLTSFKGISLERISPERPTMDRTNWHSAAQDVGFATPAYRNSQFSEGVVPEDEITLSPPVFSPDNDGYQDVLNINYKFDTPGTIATISIYDAKGRPVRSLFVHELLGMEGTLSWDGFTDVGEKARIGMYVVYIETFDVKGNTKKFKKATVLGGRL